MKEAHKNLILRLGSAAVLVPPLIWVIVWGQPFHLLIVACVAAVIALHEFYSIALGNNFRSIRIIGALLGGLTLFLLGSGYPDALLAVFAGAALVVSTLFLFSAKDIPRATNGTMAMVFGLIYVPLLLSTLVLLRRLPSGSAWVILVCMVTWFSDTAAYFVGRALGKRPLYATISPKKSIAGAVGGLGGGVIAGVVVKLWLLPSLSWLDVALIGTIGSAVGQIGDLVESMFKRAFGVKDSGTIIPGHGGLLDRIDALLFVSPFVYFYATGYFYSTWLR